MSHKGPVGVQQHELIGPQQWAKYYQAKAYNTFIGVMPPLHICPPLPHPLSPKQPGAEVEERGPWQRRALEAESL